MAWDDLHLDAGLSVRMSTFCGSGLQVLSYSDYYCG